MNTLYNICTALTVVFVVSLAVLVAEILYVLWRRRRFQSRSLATGDVEFGDESFYSTPSKELLHYFCWKNQASRIEPDAETTGAAAVVAPTLPSQPPTDVDVDVDVDVDEILKRHALYGPSRVLFTIKEEDKEEMETDLSSTENEEKKYKKNKKKKRNVSLELEELAVASMATVIDKDETTPFSTPCASPPYYTPSSSPSRNSPQTSTEDQNDVVALDNDNDDSIEVRAS